MNRRGLLCAAVIGLFALSHTASADVLAEVKKAAVLKVGTETQFAPFDYIDSGEHVGFNVDLFAAVGKEMGVQIQWVALPWAGVLPGLEAAKFDIVAGPAIITKERLERYTFSVPIAEGTVALNKRASDTAIKKPEDIAGKAVGGGRGSNQLAQLKTFAATLTPPATVREYVGADEGMADLAAGRIVAYSASLPNAAAAAKARPDMFGLVLPAFGSKAYFGYVGRKDEASASLMQAVNDAIDKLKKDGRMAALQQKWFGTTFDMPAMAAASAI